jgi:hypothetical protein
MNHRTRIYGVSTIQPRNSQLRAFPNYPQQRSIYPTLNTTRALNSYNSSEQWRTGWRIIHRIRGLVNGIIKLVHSIQSNIHGQTGAHGCSPCWVCVGATASAALIVGLSLISIYTPDNSVQGYGGGNLIHTILYLSKIRLLEYRIQALMLKSFYTSTSYTFINSTMADSTQLSTAVYIQIILISFKLIECCCSLVRRHIYKYRTNKCCWVCSAK